MDTVRPAILLQPLKRNLGQHPKNTSPPLKLRDKVDTVAGRNLAKKTGSANGLNTKIRDKTVPLCNENNNGKSRSIKNDGGSIER